MLDATMQIITVSALISEEHSIRMVHISKLSSHNLLRMKYVQRKNNNEYWKQHKSYVFVVEIGYFC